MTPIASNRKGTISKTSLKLTGHPLRSIIINLIDQLTHPLPYTRATLGTTK